MTFNIPPSIQLIYIIVYHVQAVSCQTSSSRVIWTFAGLPRPNSWMQVYTGAGSVGVTACPSPIAMYRILDWVAQARRIQFDEMCMKAEECAASKLEVQGDQRVAEPESQEDAHSDEEEQVDEEEQEDEQQESVGEEDSKAAQLQVEFPEYHVNDPVQSKEFCAGFTRKAAHRVEGMFLCLFPSRPPHVPLKFKKSKMYPTKAWQQLAIRIRQQVASLHHHENVQDSQVWKRLMTEYQMMLHAQLHRLADDLGLKYCSKPTPMMVRDTTVKIIR